MYKIIIIIVTIFKLIIIIILLQIIIIILNVIQILTLKQEIMHKILKLIILIVFNYKMPKIMMTMTHLVK